MIRKEAPSRSERQAQALVMGKKTNPFRRRSNALTQVVWLRSESFEPLRLFCLGHTQNRQALSYNHNHNIHFHFLLIFFHQSLNSLQDYTCI